MNVFIPPSFRWNTRVCVCVTLSINAAATVDEKCVREINNNQHFTHWTAPQYT